MGPANTRTRINSVDVDVRVANLEVWIGGQNLDELEELSLKCENALVAAFRDIFVIAANKNISTRQP